MAFGLLVFGLVVVGAQIRSSLDVAYSNDIQSRAIILADTKLAELCGGVVEIASYDDQFSGYFGMAYPGYSWRIRIKPTETDHLYMVTLEIGYNPKLAKEQVANPELEFDIEDDPANTKIVHTVYRLWTPQGQLEMDLDKTFGFTQEQIEQMQKDSPIPFDANNFSLQQLWSLLDQLPPEMREQLAPFMDVLEAMLSGGVGMAALEQLRDRAAGQDLLSLLSPSGGSQGKGGTSKSGDQGKDTGKGAADQGTDTGEGTAAQGTDTGEGAGAQGKNTRDRGGTGRQPGRPRSAQPSR